MMDRILRIALMQAEKYSATSILEINLTVGELTLLNPDQLRMAFEVLSEGTCAQKAKLNIETVETRIKCSRCGYVGSLSFEEPQIHLGYARPFLKCTVCGSRDLELVSGRECTIKNIKVKTSSKKTSLEENG